MAAAEIAALGGSLSVVSIHVGPSNYKQNVLAVFDHLKRKIGQEHFIVGGDLNSARHIDDVYGGQWYHRFFDSLIERGFYDCHWVI